MLRLLIIFLISVFALETNLQAQVSWQYAPVFSFATLPSGIKQRRQELGMGLSFDTHLYSQKYWRTGPGLALMATLPLDTGNYFVRVSPYSIYLEPRWTWWFVLEKNSFSVTPFIGLKSMLGTQIISRQVDRTKSSNMLWLLALGPRIGIAYWLSNYGLVCSYDISFGTNKLRQELSLSLTYLNI